MKPDPYAGLGKPVDPYAGLGSEADPYEGLGRPGDVGVIAGSVGSFRRGLRQAGQSVDAVSLAAAANLADDAAQEPARVAAEQNQDRPPDPANWEPGGPGIGGQRGYLVALEKWRARELQRQERFQMAGKARETINRQVMPAFVQAIDQRQQEIEQIPQAAGKEEYDAANGFTEKLKVAIKHPVDVIAGLSAESLPASAPALAMGAAGSLAGPVGTAAGAGMGSFAAEAGATILDQIAQTPGVDMQRPETVAAALADPAKLAAIRTKAIQRGVGVGLFDALSAGIAGRMLRHASKTKLGRAAQGAAEMGVQGALGGAGEVAGSVASGQEIDWGDVLSEVLGEAGSGAAEIATGVVRDRAQADARTQDTQERETGKTPASPASPASPQSPTSRVLPTSSDDLAAEIAGSLPDAESRDVLAGRSAQAEAAKLKDAKADFGATVQSVVDTLLAANATPAQLDALDFQLRTLTERAGKRTRLKPEQVNTSLGNTFLIEALPAAEVFPLVSKLADNTANVETLRAGLARMRGKDSAGGSVVPAGATRGPDIATGATPPTAPAGTLSPEARAAKIEELKTREREAEAAKQRAEQERQAAAQEAQAAEKEKTRRIRDENKRLAELKATGRDPATGRIADLTAVPDSEIDLLDLEKEGITEQQLEAEMERRYRAAERAAAVAPERSQTDWAEFLRRRPLPRRDAVLQGELDALAEEMTPRQRMEYFRTDREGNLDGHAEAARADYGFAQVMTPADVIETTRRMLRGEQVRFQPRAEEGARFARRDQTAVEDAPTTRAGAALLQKRMVAAREVGQIRSYMNLRRRWLHSLATIDPNAPANQLSADEAKGPSARQQATADNLPGDTGTADRPFATPTAEEPTTPATEVAAERTGRGIERRIQFPQQYEGQTDVPGSTPAPESLQVRPTLKEIERAIERGATDRDAAARAINAMLEVQAGVRSGPDIARAQWMGWETGAIDEASASALAKAIRRFDAGGRFVWPSEDLREKVMQTFFARRPKRPAPEVQSAEETRWWENFRRIAPGVAREFELRFGDPSQLVESGDVSAEELTGEEQAVYIGRRRGAMRGIIHLFEKALRANTDEVTRLNLLHEIGHAYYDLLDPETQDALREQWRDEIDHRTGPLFDANGNLRSNVALGVETEVQEWLAERLAHANSEWAARRIFTRARGDTLIQTIAAQFRALLVRVREYIERAFGRNGYADALTGDFREFLNQGARWLEPEIDDVQEFTGRLAKLGIPYARREQAAPLPQRWQKSARDAAIMSNGAALKAHEYYAAAKGGSIDHAWFVTQALLAPAKVQRLAQAHPRAILVPVIAQERAGTNKLPFELAKEMASQAPGWTVTDEIIQMSGAGHTSASALHRLATPPTFAGPVEAGREYILIDDVLTSGSTINALRAHVEAEGGRVVAVAAFSASSNPQTGYGGQLAPRPEVVTELDTKFGRGNLNALLREYGIANELESLTNSQAKYLATYASVERIRTALARARIQASGEEVRRDSSHDARAEAAFGQPPPRRADQGELRFARREQSGDEPRTPEQLLRDYASLERTRDRYLDEGNRTPRHVLTGLSDLREALENALPGWRDRLSEMKAQAAPAAAPSARPSRASGEYSSILTSELPPEPEDGVGAVFGEQTPAISPEATAAKRSQLEASTLRRPNGLREWLSNLARAFTGFKSAIPELPGGAEGRPFARFRQGYRMLQAATEFVRKDAEERIAHVVQPLTDVGRAAVAPARYRELQELQRIRERQIEDNGRVRPELAARIGAIETELEEVPYHLFRKVVLYRDLFFRSRLRNPNGEPLTLPFSLTQGEIESTLRELHQRLGQSPHRAAIEEALKRHYALIKNVRDGLLARGYIIPEELRNPLYFPHLVLDKTNTALQRVKLDTAEDFRGYLVQLTGSDRSIETDYLQAMYHHLATVEAHNARQDVVEKYWQPYDIRTKLEAEAKELNAQRAEQGQGPLHWRQLIPADHVAVTIDDRIPLRPEVMINRQVLADRLGVALGEGDLQAQLRELGLNVTLTADDFRTALAAGERVQWVVPKPVAEAMRAIIARETRTAGAVERTLSAPQSLWKRWTLFAPHNVIRYTYGNLTSDLEKLFSADPGVFRQLAPAWREVRAFYHGQTPSADLKEAFRRGVLDAVTAGEVTDLAAQQLDRFESFLTSGEHFSAMMKRGLGWGVTVNRIREAAFRFAKFKADLERQRAGREPVYAGAYSRDVRAITEETAEATHYARAAEISRKTFGDYSDISVNGDYLRRLLMPFYSWTEVNFRYHVNLFRNLGDMTAGAGMAQIARQSASAASRVLVARSATGVLLRLALPYVAVQLWNNSGDREKLEKTLSDEDRRRFHLIIGKDERGKTVVVYAPTALSDFMRWFGGNDFARLAAEYTRGDITLAQLTHEWAGNLPKDLVNNVVQGVGPVFKSAWTAMFRKTTFPDILDQRSIPDHDRWWAVLGNMMDGASADGMRRLLDSEHYSARTAGEWAQQLILQARRRDPVSWGYSATMDRVDAYKAAHGGVTDPGVNNKADAQLLLSFRRAIRAADVPAATAFYQRLLAAGYTQERFRATIDHADPLATIKREHRAEFVATLSAAEKEDLRNAYKYAARMKNFEPYERRLFASKNATKGYRDKFTAAGGRPEFIRQVIETTRARTDAESDTRADELLRRALRRR
jgi:hypothetical protein